MRYTITGHSYFSVDVDAENEDEASVKAEAKFFEVCASDSHVEPGKFQIDAVEESE